MKEIIVCSVLPGEQACLQLRRKDLNDLLRNLCCMQNVHFLDNDRQMEKERNIVLSKHIDGDGVHLNGEGSDLLRDNIVELLNSFNC